MQNTSLMALSFFLFFFRVVVKVRSNTQLLLPPLVPIPRVSSSLIGDECRSAVRAAMKSFSMVVQIACNT